MNPTRFLLVGYFISAMLYGTLILCSGCTDDLVSSGNQEPTINVRVENVDSIKDIPITIQIFALDTSWIEYITIKCGSVYNITAPLPSNITILSPVKEPNGISLLGTSDMLIKWDSLNWFSMELIYP